MSTSKLTSLSEAVGLIEDGDQIITGGWTIIRKTMAAAYEIVRQRKRDLHLVTGTGGTDTDLLIGAGSVSIGEGSYIGHEGLGHAYAFWRAVERDPEESGFRYDDCSLQMSWLRVQAAAMGIPFLPTVSVHGSDILNPEYDTLKEYREVNPKLPKKKYARMVDPFWEGQEVILVPAIRPDVAIIHVLEAAEDGTANVTGCPFGDRLLSMAAEKTIITAEKIVPIDRMHAHPSATTIPGVCVTAVCEAPFGSHPTQMDQVYDYDIKFFREYVQASKKEETFESWLSEWVFGVKDHAEYLKKVGMENLEKLRADSEYGYRPDISNSCRNGSTAMSSNGSISTPTIPI